MKTVTIYSTTPGLACDATNEDGLLCANVHNALPAFDHLNNPIEYGFKGEALEVTQLFSPTVGWVDKPNVPLLIQWVYETRQIYRALPPKDVSNDAVTTFGPLSTHDKVQQKETVSKMGSIEQELTELEIAESAEKMADRYASWFGIYNDPEWNKLRLAFLAGERYGRLKQIYLPNSEN